MRQVNQYSEQVRDMHIVMFERHTRTSGVLLCSKRGKNAPFHICQHLNKSTTTSKVQQYKNCTSCIPTSEHRHLATEEHATAQQSRLHTQPSYMPLHKERTREAGLTFYRG